MTTEELVQQMRAAAEKATPGPWVQDGHHMSQVLRCTAERGSPEAKHTCGDYSVVADASENWMVDAPFIVAANPTNVLALIADRDAQKARADAADAEVKVMREAMCWARDRLQEAAADDPIYEEHAAKIRAQVEAFAAARAALASEAS